MIEYILERRTIERMEVNINVWQITEFAEKIAEGVGGSIHYNTVDKWFKELERRRIHYIQRVAGEKVYDELDLKIGCYIYQKRQEKWRLDAIFEHLPDVIDVRPFPADWESNDGIEVNQIEQRILYAVMEEMRKEINKTKEEILRSVKEIATTELASMLPKPKDDIQDRMEKFNTMILQKRLEQKLEEEALQLWNEKPKEERIKKVGWFRKEEDIEKRDMFVRKYKQNNFEWRLKKELGLDDH
jgi:hypothetical protein